MPEGDTIFRTAEVLRATLRPQRPRRSGGSLIELRTRAAVLVQIAAAVVIAALGWWQLGAKDLSLDELANLDYVTRPLPEFIKVITERQANMALHSLAMIPWAAVRDTEVWLRIPSVFAAVATVPLLFRVGERLLSRRAAAIAVLLFAVSPLIVEQAQTARAYTFAALASVVVTLFFLRAVESPSRGRILAFGLATGGALYVHFVLAFVGAAHGVTVLARLQDPVRRRFLMAGAAAAIVGAPLAIFILVADAGQIGWIQPLSIERITTTAGAVIGGSLPTVVFWSVGIVMGVAILVRRQPTDAQFTVLSWFLVPIGLILAVSIVKPLLVPRYFIIIIPAAVLIVGWWLATFRGRAMAALLGIGLVASSFGVASWYGTPSPRWRDATHYVVTAAEENDAIMYAVPWASRAFAYYAERFGVPDRLPEPISLLDLYRTDARKIWVAMAQLDEGERLAFASFLESRWELVRSFGYDGVSLRQYVRRSE
jgi:hypothetical protein